MTAKRATRWILVGLIVLTVLGLIGYGIFCEWAEKYGLPPDFYKAETDRRLPLFEKEWDFYDRMAKLPAPLPPGIRIGQGWTGKRVIYSDEKLGRVTALARQNDRYIAAGEGGAVSFDTSLQHELFTPFNKCQDCVVDIVQEGASLWFLMQSEQDPMHAGLIDASGCEQYTGGGCCGPCVAGDLTGDGIPDFIQNERGIITYNVPAQYYPGYDVWTDIFITDVKVVDLEGKGRKEIACSTYAAQFVVCGLDSRVRIHRNLPFLVRSFCFSAWPERGSALCLVTARESDVVVLNLKCREVKRFSLPSANWASLHATPVRLKTSEQPYFAVCGGYEVGRDVNWPSQGFFAIFDPNGNLVYHEMTAKACRAVLTIAQGTSGTEALLVGIGKEIWMFTAP